MKYEVLEKIRLTVDKGSIVVLDPIQFERAKKALKPVKETKKKAETKTEETAEE